MFGSLISGLLGVGSNLLGTSLNQSNFEDQMNFARYQYQDMRERQDPKYQVKRMRAAGLNPALNASNIAMGQTSSVSQPSSHPANVLDIGGLASIGNQLDLNNLSAENIRSQTIKNTAEAENTSILSETQLMKRGVEIEKILADKNLSDSQRAYYLSQRDFIQKLLKYQDEKSEWENHNLRLEAINKSLQNEAMTIHNAYLPQLTELQCRELLSVAYMNSQSGKLYGESAEKVKQETISEVIRSGILGNDFFKGLPDGLKGESLYKAMKLHPNFRKFETALDLVLNRLNSLPISASYNIK